VPTRKHAPRWLVLKRTVCSSFRVGTGWPPNKKDARQAARPILLCYRNSDYQLSFSVYLPLVEPVPPL